LEFGRLERGQRGQPKNPKAEESPKFEIRRRRGSSGCRQTVIALDWGLGFRIWAGATSLGDLLARSGATVFFAFLVLKGLYYASRS